MKQQLLLLFMFIATALFAQTDSVSSKSEAQTPSIYTIVDQNPEFPGGEEGIIRFLAQNIQYPGQERKKDIQGKVILKFVVNEDGHVSDVTVVRGVSPGIDAEATRVTQLLPRFKPGRIKGQPVKVYYHLPVVFKLQ